jgi:Ca-activated chloride channel family protein
MRGHRFVKFDPNAEGKTRFEQLLDMFLQMLTYTSGDVAEALQWMNQLDKEYKLTDEEYGMGDFIEDLKKNGYIREDNQTGTIVITTKS